jgi:subtilisin-like proprotein convertase family protein
MLRVKVKQIMEGPGPSEAIVSIKTEGNREEELVVQKSQIKDNTLHVWPVGEKQGSVLVELPGESASGNWRLWIDNREVA